MFIFSAVLLQKLQCALFTLKACTFQMMQLLFSLRVSQSSLFYLPFSIAADRPAREQTVLGCNLNNRSENLNQICVIGGFN